MKNNFHYSLAILSICVILISIFIIFLSINYISSHHQEEHESRITRDLFYAWHQFDGQQRSFAAVDSLFRTYLSDQKVPCPYVLEFVEVDGEGNERVLDTFDHVYTLDKHAASSSRIEFDNNYDVFADLSFDIEAFDRKHMLPFMILTNLVIVFILLSVYLAASFIHANKTLGRTKRTFVSIIAHNMRNPISIAHVASEALMSSDGIGNIDNGTVFSSIILNQLDNLDSQINYLLSTVKLWSHSFTEEFMDFALKPIVEKNVRRFEIMSPSAVFEIDVDPSHSVRFIPDQISSILFILLENSIKYCNTTPHIVISSEKDRKGRISLSVRDNGIGFSKDERQNAFKEYSRGRRGASLSPKGYGLGLHYIYYLANLTKGYKVSIKSKEGAGATVTLKNFKAVQN